MINKVFGPGKYLSWSAATWVFPSTCSCKGEVVFDPEMFDFLLVPRPASKQEHLGKRGAKPILDQFFWVFTKKKKQ